MLQAPKSGVDVQKTNHNLHVARERNGIPCTGCNEAGRPRVASRESSLLYCRLTILLVGQTVQKTPRTDSIRLGTGAGLDGRGLAEHRRQELAQNCLNKRHIE